MSGGKEDRELRRFGLLVGGVFGVIAILPVVFRGDRPRGWAGLIATLLIVLGVTIPRALRLVYRVWMRAGHSLGWLNTRLLLGVMYFLVMTPTAMLMRLVGRDPLDRRLRDRSSYWVGREAYGDRRRLMERHF